MAAVTGTTYPGGGNPIGGLTDGATYYAIAMGGNSYRLADTKCHATGAADDGVVERSDLTGFNWADVPAILVETGFLTNPAERRRLLDPRYRLRVARGLAAGVAAFVRP